MVFRSSARCLLPLFLCSATFFPVASSSPCLVAYTGTQPQPDGYSNTSLYGINPTTAEVTFLVNYNNNGVSTKPTGVQCEQGFDSRLDVAVVTNAEADGNGDSAFVVGMAGKMSPAPLLIHDLASNVSFCDGGAGPQFWGLTALPTPKTISKSGNRTGSSSDTSQPFAALLFQQLTLRL